MKFRNSRYAILFAVGLGLSTVVTADVFTVRAIRVEGVQGLSEQTVLSYLPIKAGQSWDESHSNEVIRALYRSGLFEDVKLERSADTLIVRIVERNIIGTVHTWGNSTLTKDELASATQSVGLVSGNVFKPAMLEAVKVALEAAYRKAGKSGATVTATSKQSGPHRMIVDINVNEGTIVKISDISFTGNNSFSAARLRYQLPISETGIFTWITHKDRYSPDKLEVASEVLRNFYLDHGYLKATVDKPIVSVREDNNKKVTITFPLHEGQRYRVQDIGFSGQLIVPEAELRKALAFKPGEYYSQSLVQESIDNMAVKVGNHGYGYASITTEPVFDEAHRQVNLRFHVEPGPQLYVRRIHFAGNYRTADVVLRRAMRQDEGALLSVGKIRESERQLRILNYFDQVDVKTRPVPGSTNQVDLDFNVNELPGAEAMATVGYGTEGPVFSLELNQANFLGTGRSIGAAFRKSKVLEQYALNYFNPYFTNDGIGMGVDLFYQKLTPGRIDVARYTSDEWGTMVRFFFPLNDYDKVRLGAGISTLHISRLGSNPSQQLQQFLNANGNDFRQAKLEAAWIHNNLDKVPFPTEGTRQDLTFLLAVPAGADGLHYYKAGYNIQWFHPLGNDFIFNTRGNVGYGHTYGNDKDYPFFENYYAGGLVEPGTVRGFESYSLGPRDSNNDPLGGNFLLNGGVGLIFPNLISRDKLRTQVFLDVGNVYDRDGTRFEGTGAGRLRTSAGFQLDYYSPLGPLTFVIAAPLNKQRGDDRQLFDFTVKLPI